MPEWLLPPPAPHVVFCPRKIFARRAVGSAQPAVVPLFCPRKIDTSCVVLHKAE
eukprot:CAMPEP_0113320960 /NCGR_PEP_ID=MMETSP0010_2-20120614/14605_1 /TAXON_ID=216773 ORGANISM="Corethron hystrix, Strain 308" /NCGR_SAMPLE_ID=MMETSP0010_2 /ASSEMBLY_ACC=CAM_ASM_000155 /LENGTH=53 /DNA_ID=CAMNT_0000178937 /DNA_START=1 /DNA_END=159 /DNA_ORIENTATION=+ /assembly_acc=CAM_ASM_000155